MHKMVPSVIGLASCVFAFGAHAGTFLEDLAANHNRVESSPYATGGNVILCLDATIGEYVHVFTNTTASSFVIESSAGNMSAKILAVGGGGSGGYCYKGSSGGGGGGGMVYLPSVAMTAGATYTVSVGAGGYCTNGGTHGGNGGNSSVSNDVESIVTAIGGGGGGGNAWGGTNGTGANGGSGGGSQWHSNASSVYNKGGLGTEGQGNRGGDILYHPSFALASGGGGAGAAAPDITEFNTVGTGGDGLPCNILGFEQYFAGGGAGHQATITVNGGLGGGGSVIAGANGLPGESGLGGGGGGRSSTGYSINGGSGIVAIRYIAAPSTTPYLRAANVACNEGNVVVVDCELALAGSADASVFAKFWPTSGTEDGEGTVVVPIKAGIPAQSADVPCSKTVSSLAFATGYSYKIYATNSVGTSNLKEGSVTTKSASLMATGGTIVTNNFRVIHTFSESGTFTVGASGYAEVLVVGGGGAGGYGDNCRGAGGGGGGGVLYSESTYLAAGTYAVVVGAGAIPASNATTWATAALDHGKNSSLTLASTTEQGFSFDGMVAIGGGSGVSWGGNNDLHTYTFGSSGGGTRNVTSIGKIGLATEGQGHMGAYCYTGSGVYDRYIPGGGGGWAESPALGSGVSTDTFWQSGHGGAGFPCSISGEIRYYGAGGGGGGFFANPYTCLPGEPGSVGAGRGCSKFLDGGEAATSGVDGTGCGGGGGGHKAYLGGRGGNGIVIVRYFDYASAQEAVSPVVTVDSFSNETADSADVKVSLVSGGTVNLIASWGYAPDALTEGSCVLDPAFCGTKVFTFGGLNPGRTYHVAISANNGAGEPTVIRSSFTTKPAIQKALNLSSGGGVVTYEVEKTPNGETVLQVLVDRDGADTYVKQYSEADLIAEGIHSVTPFTSEMFGSRLSMRIRLISTVDGMSFTNDSPVLSTTLSDTLVYTWNSAVADGYWDDAANWIATPDGAMGRGYPIATSTAQFVTNLSATVRVRRAESCMFFFTQFENMNLRFIGEGAGAAIRASAKKDNSDRIAFAKNSTYVFDNLVIKMYKGNGYATDNSCVKLLNGTYFELTGGSPVLFYMDSPGVVYEVGNGSTNYSASVTMSYGANLIVSNGCMKVSDSNSAGNGLNLANKANSAPCTVTLRGDNPVLYVGRGIYAANTNATICFEIAKNGFKAPAIVMQPSNPEIMFGDASRKKITLTVPKSAPVRSAKKGDWQLALSGANGINVANVLFGATATSNGFFYYTDASANKYVYCTDGTGALAAMEAPETALASQPVITGIWYHHSPSSGMTVILR